MNPEREFTDRLRARFPQPTGMLVGLGDDAAVLPKNARPQAVAVDPVVEGVHFAPGTAWDQVGRKAVNRNLSDLAAMGALPRWLLVSLVLRRGMAPAEVDALLAGLAAAAEAVGAAVIGGDTTVVDGPVVVTVTAGGDAPDRPLTRSGARVGDRIHLTGPVGGALGGGHLTFRPHVEEGNWLAGLPQVHSAMDVSDGVLLDLHTMLAASSRAGTALGADLDPTAIVLADGAAEAAGNPTEAELLAALRRGEDHVLLFTAAGDLPDGGPLAAACRRPVGFVTAGGSLRFKRPDGSFRDLPPEGWQHEVPRS